MKERYQIFREKKPIGNKKCLECNKELPYWKHKYCSDDCQRKKYKKKV